MQFFNPYSFTLKFPFEPGYRYRLFPHQIRLERQPILNTGVSEAYLHPEGKYRFNLFDTIVPPPVIHFSVPKQELILPVDRNSKHESYATSINGKYNLLALLPKITSCFTWCFWKRLLLAMIFLWWKIVALVNWLRISIPAGIRFLWLLKIGQWPSLPATIPTSTEPWPLEFFQKTFTPTTPCSTASYRFCKSRLKQSHQPILLLFLKDCCRQQYLCAIGRGIHQGAGNRCQRKFPVAFALVGFEKYRWFTRTDANGKYELMVKSVGYIYYENRLIYGKTSRMWWYHCWWTSKASMR